MKDHKSGNLPAPVGEEQVREELLCFGQTEIRIAKDAIILLVR